MSVADGHDATHANASHLPKGQAAGYTTGSADIQWTDADWKAHPGAVRICQDAGATDHTADVLDVERGAAANNDAAAWYSTALTSYNTSARPGQRSPAIYTSLSNVTPLVDALLRGGVKSARLWVANWNLTRQEAVTDVENAGGPFPVVAVQYSSGPLYDFDVFDAGWLARVSQPAPTAHATLAGDTVADIARSRNTPIPEWMALQEKLGAKVNDLAAGPLPAGVTWYSEDP